MLSNARQFDSVSRAVRSRLAREWPEVCAGHVEDALQEAIIVLMRRAEVRQRLQAAGEAHLLRYLHRVAWKKVRGRWRRSSSRLEDPRWELPDVTTAQACFGASTDLHALVERFVPAAAYRFGFGQPEALARALRDCLLNGASDVDAARSHGVTREALCRSRGWITERARLC